MTKSTEDLEVQIQCLCDLAVSLSTTLLRYIQHAAVNESRGANGADASGLSHVAEQCFRCARLPGVQRQIADHLDSAGQEFLRAAPEFHRPKHGGASQGNAVATVPSSFPGEDLLTDRERAVLAQIVRGASSREAGRVLDVSPRTIDFHRANIMQKLGAKNLADLVRIVLGE